MSDTTTTETQREAEERRTRARERVAEIEAERDALQRDAGALPDAIAEVAGRLVAMIRRFRSIGIEDEAARLRLLAWRRVAGDLDAEAEDPIQTDPADRDRVSVAAGNVGRAMAGTASYWTASDLDLLDVLVVATDPAPARDVEGLDRDRVDLVTELARRAGHLPGHRPHDPGRLEPLVDATRGLAAELAARLEG